MSILVVDDQSSNLIALEAALANGHYGLTIARSAADALQRLLQQDFAVIVLNAQMPASSGFETARLIRSQKRSESTPIIFLTDHETSGRHLLESDRLGAVDYVYTPLDPAVIRAKVDLFVDLSRTTAAVEQCRTELITTSLQLEQRSAELPVTAAQREANHKGTDLAVYSPNEDDVGPDRLALLGELQRAIEHDELILHYQPLLDLRQGTVRRVEALVRWQHPQRGLLSPGEFIPLAELTGVIQPLSRWVLQTAMRQQQVWRTQGIAIPVAINLSRRMVHDPNLPETVAQLLASSGVPSSALFLEITESSLIGDPLAADENLKQLRALGVCVSIDDFGTGYSSLAALKNLPVDELKIDQSFVGAMATDASARAIVRAIIDLAAALKLLVVAEGVEDRATWDVLAGLGCDVAQGYWLCPPIAAAELEKWILVEAPLWLDVAATRRPEDPLNERIRSRGARLTAEEEFVARKRAEAALLASEERNRLALQAAAMGTWERDVLHNVYTWSTETEALHGLTPGSFDGTTSAVRRTIHPDDWPAFEEELAAAAVQHRETIATFRTVWPNGSVHWIEAKGRAQYAEDGSLLRINGTSMEITERKLAEEALRTSEERFRLQYKGAPLPSYSWGQIGDDFIMLDYNDAAEALDGVEVQQWIGRRASERYADQPAVLASLSACIAQRRTIRQELRSRHPVSGHERELALTFVFIPPQTVVVYSDDVTERKQIELHRAAMARSEKLRALGQMASGIAHDLNQSLMLVTSYSELAVQSLKKPTPNLPEIEDLLTTATQAALDGGATVKRLLMFTRTAAEQDTQSVDLGNLVHDAAQLTAPRWRDGSQAEGHPINLEINVQGQPIIQGSPAQLREVMTNLIFNAVDALPMGGTIRLRVAAEFGDAIIEVVDTGIGMTAEVQERVFEPFFTTKGERGTGLGLAMVFGMVEQHGGHIDVRSEVGKGTTFRVALPLAVDTSAEAGRSLTEPPLLASLRPLRVLVVDDEPMMTKAVARMLKPSGHLVTVADSGEQALEKLAQNPFDVVVSDMGMGAGMNGWDLADVVRARWPGVHFLLATGWGAAIDSAEAHDKGVEAVLAKPYRPEELLETLARLGKTG